MIPTRWITVLVAATLCSASAATAAEIAVVNMATCLRAHPDTDADTSLLEQQAETYESEHADMLAEREKLIADIEEARDLAQTKALSDEVREQNRAIVERKYRELKEYETTIRQSAAKRQREFNERKLQMQRRIVESVRELVRDYATKQGYAIVLDAAAVSVSGVESVLFHQDAIDITDAIVEKLGGKPESAGDKPGE